MSFERKTEQINAEALLDGIYVLRTDLEPKALDTTSTVRAYKDLAHVERAFRSLKTVDLQVRPIHHRRADRVRAHVLICMLAYHLEWHMRRALKPILFDDHDKAAAEAARTSIVAKETTTINGLAVAGPGSAYNDSDWNGSAGYPLPQLWDDTGHNVTAASPRGTTRLNVTFKTNSATPDCLTPVANVVEVH